MHICLAYSQIPKFELSYFSSNFNTGFCKMIIFMGYWWIIKIICLYLEKGSKFHILGRLFLTIEIVKQDKCLKYTGSNKLMFPAYYCVQQFTVSSKILCFYYTLVQLFLVKMLWSYHALLCIAIYCILSYNFVMGRTFFYL